jgi:hypothetical protein
MLRADTPFINIGHVKSTVVINIAMSLLLRDQLSMLLQQYRFFNRNLTAGWERGQCQKQKPKCLLCFLIWMEL